LEEEEEEEEEEEQEVPWCTSAVAADKRVIDPVFRYVSKL